MSEPHHRPRPHDHLVEPFYEGLLHHGGEGSRAGRLRPGPGVLLALLALGAALWWLTR